MHEQHLQIMTYQDLDIHDKINLKAYIIKCEKMDTSLRRFFIKKSLCTKVLCEATIGRFNINVSEYFGKKYSNLIIVDDEIPF